MPFWKNAARRPMRDFSHSCIWKTPIKWSIVQFCKIQQKSLSNDQYPKAIPEENNVLSNHLFDDATNIRMKKEINKSLIIIKMMMKHQNLLLLIWKRNVSAMEEEVINFLHVVIRANSNRNGKWIPKNLRMSIYHILWTLRTKQQKTFKIQPQIPTITTTINK